MIEYNINYELNNILYSIYQIINDKNYEWNPKSLQSYTLWSKVCDNENKDKWPAN